MNSLLLIFRDSIVSILLSEGFFIPLNRITDQSNIINEDRQRKTQMKRVLASKICQWALDSGRYHSTATVLGDFDSPEPGSESASDWNVRVIWEKFEVMPWTSGRKYTVLKASTMMITHWHEPLEIALILEAVLWLFRSSQVQVVDKINRVTVTVITTACFFVLHLQTSPTSDSFSPL